MRAIIYKTGLLLTICLSLCTGLYAQFGKMARIVSEEVSYTLNGKTMKSFVAYNAGQQGPRPAIIVVPEWWGITDYTKKRAKMLAGLGYIAIVADMYGEGKVAENPTDAKANAMPFYEDPTKGKTAIDAAIDKIKQYPQTDVTRIAAIGYCFGGSMVLNAIKMGVDFRGVVSFHGGLATVPAKKGAIKGKILVCHGDADKFISAKEKNDFRKNLDTTNTEYKFISYKGATHAFTNPNSTEIGKKFNLPISYSEEADKKSWSDMQEFFNTIF